MRVEPVLLAVVASAGLVAVIVSPVPEYSSFRLGLFLVGILTWLGVAAWATTPARIWLVVAAIAAAACVVTVGGLMASNWMIHKFPPIAAVLIHLPRVPDAVLGSLGAPARVSPNQLAGLLALIVPVLTGPLLFALGARVRPCSPPRWVPFLIAAALLAACAYLGLSVARWAIVALSIGLVLLIFLRSVRWGLFVVGAGALAIVAAGRLLPPQFVGALLFSEIFAPQWFAGVNRYEYWQGGWDLLGASPWSGIGLGAFPPLYLARVAARGYYACIVVPHAHNLPLQAALDLGIPGALAYLGLIGAGAGSAFRAARRFGGGPAAGLGYGLAAGLLAFALFGLFDTITVTSRATLLIWAIAGLGTALGRLACGDAMAHPPEPTDGEEKAALL